MSVLGARQINDMVTGTLSHLEPNRFQQIAQELQHYEIMGKWLKADKVVLDHGEGIKRNLMHKTGGTFKHVGLYQKRDDLNVVDLLKQLTIPWVRAETYWAYDIDEINMNRGRALITNIIKPRRAGAMIDMAQGLEDAGWSSPALADTHLPYGVPYYIVKNNTVGFNGGLPSGHSTIAGINITTVANYKNYTGLYVDVSRTDLIDKMRTGMRKMNWQSPVTIQDYRGKMGQDMRVYMNDATIAVWERVAEDQNDNLGPDVASMDGTTTIKKHPVIYVPKLDEDSSNPVYMIDHQSFYPVVLANTYMREGEPMNDIQQANVFIIFLNLLYNFVCIDRRRNAVFNI